ncbi:TonB-dependent receptor [Iodidimonas sp. SYSU 1G8]|uniref:TonB-dependent receptor n=1 Tax=Iodidimonas sp. SYSU 1G8 TaxID=3133967 RepID=UPI0031FE8431
MKKDKLRTLMIGGATVALSGLAFAWTPVIAQDAPAAAAPSQSSVGVLESVTVSGTKRESNQQETPIAISTVTSAQLENTFISDVRAVAQMAPNVILSNVTGFNALAPAIRGAGTNGILVTQDAAIGLVIDEFALSSVQSQFVELFDIEQVEVYRGPQGTLFGKSTTGGAMAITTKKPEMNEYFGQAELTFGGYGREGGNIGKGKLAINVPVVDDKLAIRITGVYDYSDGYYRNDKDTSTFPNLVPFYAALGLPTVNPPMPAGLDTSTRGSGEHLGGRDVLAMKAKALFTPTDNYEALFTFELVRDRSDSPPGVNETVAVDRFGTQFLLPRLGFIGIADAGVGDNPFSTGISNQNTRAQNVAKGHSVNVEGFYLNQSMEFDSFTVKSITGYRMMEETLPSTYPGEAFNNLFDSSRNLERKMFQQELRMVTNFDGPFNFVAGGQYFMDNMQFRAFSSQGFQSLYNFHRTGPTLGTTPSPVQYYDAMGNLNLNLDYINDPTVTGSEQYRDTYAVYFDFNYDITDRLTFNGGVRYTYDKKKFVRFHDGNGPCTSATQLEYQRYPNDDPNTPGVYEGPCFDSRSNAISRAGLTANDVNPRENPLPLSAFGLNVNTQDSWKRLTWRAVVDYKVTDEIMTYAGYSTGFLAGGFTETCSGVATCVPFNPEKNWNIEAGLKADLFDRTLRFNLAAFYTRYNNLQRNQVVPYINSVGNLAQETITVNAGESESYGLELETVWVPVDNVRVDFTMGYLKSKYLDFQTDYIPSDAVLISRGLCTASPCSANGVPGANINGNLDDGTLLTVPFSPKWNIGMGITYDMDLGNTGTLTWNANFHYQSKAEWQVFNSENTQLQERFLLNASLTYRDLDERYRVTVYGKNLLNEVYRTNANSVAGLWNFTQYGAPIEWGIEAGFYF